MATDYGILEKELIDLKKQLTRDLHLHQMRRLKKRQGDLSKRIAQRKKIEKLNMQIAEIEPTVSTVYCPQNSLQDDEIKGYLVYLLKMKDFFTREVETKQEMINQEEAQIKMLSRKLRTVVNEQAMVTKKIPEKSPEFIRLENMCSRVYQMHQRISVTKHENSEIVENIMNMRKFQCQFKPFEKDFRRKINHLKGKSHQLLEKAVAAYEEKDEITRRKIILEERSAEDLRRNAINENALNFSLLKAEKNNAFAELQNEIPMDVRMEENTAEVKRDSTHLEINLEENKQIQPDNYTPEREDSPENTEEEFKLGQDNIGKTLSYLDELLRSINELQGVIDSLKEDNSNLLKNTGKKYEKVMVEIKMNQDIAQSKLDEDDEDISEIAKSEELLVFDTLKSLYIKCCPDDQKLLEQIPVDSSSAMDYVQDMENQLLEYLICLVRIRMKKEISDEDQSLVLESEKEVDVDDEEELKKEDTATINNRKLSGEYEPKSDVEELKKIAADALKDLHSEISSDGDEETY